MGPKGRSAKRRSRASNGGANDAACTDSISGEASCCVVGGGPAGMMLGYLLARAGVDVMVLTRIAHASQSTSTFPTIRQDNCNLQSLFVQEVSCPRSAC